MTNEEWLQSRGFALRFNGGSPYWQRGRFTAYDYVSPTLVKVWRANDTKSQAYGEGVGAPEAFDSLRNSLAGALAEAPQ